MTIHVDTTLYYATWCGHCVHFKPEWEKLKKKIKSLNGKFNNIALTLHEYESENMPKNARINGQEIQGFPTIKVTVTKNGGNTQEFDYNGKRDSEHLFYYITNEAIKHI